MILFFYYFGMMIMTQLHQVEIKFCCGLDGQQRLDGDDHGKIEIHLRMNGAPLATTKSSVLCIVLPYVASMKTYWVERNGCSLLACASILLLKQSLFGKLRTFCQTGSAWKIRSVVGSQVNISRDLAFPFSKQQTQRPNTRHRIRIKNIHNLCLYPPSEQCQSTSTVL
jgi:hypothetical protein